MSSLIIQNAGIVLVPKNGFVGTRVTFPALYNLHVDNFKVNIIKKVLRLVFWINFASKKNLSCNIGVEVKVDVLE